MTNELPPRVVAGIAFIGRGGGAVKGLSGFKKSHHTVPDAANAVTNAFLGKIAAPELEAAAEELFQQVRAKLGYKRKDVSVSSASGSAVLTAKDFTVEIAYALEESDPSHYVVTTTLRELRNAQLAETPEFDEIFRGRFTEISFSLQKGAKVEAIIDVIEALDGEKGLGVQYPSDCRECTIGVEGIEATVRCTGASLEMVFPRAGSPRELMDAFAEVRSAFAVNDELAGMI